MRVRELMTPRPVRVSPATSLMEARRLLARHDVRHLPVVAGDAVVGVVSDRDLVLRDRRLADALDRLHCELVDGRYRRVADVMSSPAVTVEADTPAATAATLLRTRRISALPVVDDGRLVGIVTTTDLLGAVADDPSDDLLGYLSAPPQSPGDARPGRPPRRPAALVVDPDAATRSRLAADLSAEGYEVTTCPGPCTPTNCPAQDGPGGERCPRLPADVDLIVVDQASARTRLLEAYAAWAPRAQMEVTGTLPVASFPRVAG